MVITPDDIELVKQMCNQLCISFCYAKEEAESFCSFLCQQKQIDLVVTEDTDVLAYGSPLWFSSMDHNGMGIEIEFENVSTKITRLTNKNLY